MKGRFPTKIARFEAAHDRVGERAATSPDDARRAC
jgi:hypothetical protein